MSKIRGAAKGACVGGADCEDGWRVKTDVDGTTKPLSNRRLYRP
jgi:hypothetical protein